MLTMPGVIASYHTNAAQDDYRLFGTNKMRGAERSWFVRHGEELVDTMAEPSGPDVVGLLATDVTYGVMGDHGGHNKLIQNIPMVFSGPGIGSKDSEQGDAARRRAAHDPRDDGHRLRPGRPRRRGGEAAEALTDTRQKSKQSSMSPMSSRASRGGAGAPPAS